MTSDREFGESKGATLSLVDLQQIKEAVSELRTASPDSALADLVEERIRALEIEHPAIRHDDHLFRVRHVLN